MLLLVTLYLGFLIGWMSVLYDASVTIPTLREEVSYVNIDPQAIIDLNNNLSQQLEILRQQEAQRRALLNQLLINADTIRGQIEILQS